LKWHAEQRFSSKHTHPEEAADEDQPRAKLVADVIADSWLRHH
jgi:hypothetical protein